MAKYLYTGSYTMEGARGILAEGGSSRRAAVDKLAASVGGTVESFHLAFGSDDFFIITDLPDNAAAAALALTVSASGAVNVRTVVLMTPDEIDAATKLSPAYRAPGTLASRPSWAGAVAAVPARRALAHAAGRRDPAPMPDDRPGMAPRPVRPGHPPPRAPRPAGSPAR